jgi:predicted phosphodiesterase
LPATIDRIVEILEYAKSHGDSDTCDTFSVTQETLARYRRRERDLGFTDDPDKRVLLKQIADTYNYGELRAIAKGGAISPLRKKPPNVNFSGEHIRFGAMGDTHFGSIFTSEEMYDLALAEMRKADCSFIVHVGDVCEGMSNRAGHVYELSKIGYSAQKEYATAMLRKWDKPWYVIDGNHDRWFIKSAGAKIVPEICDEIESVHFLGHDVGELPLKGGVKVMLWHGEDGSSYATSYRLQKIVESLAGGTKPNLMLCGHTHKQAYFFERNIHVLSCGSIQQQTDWMRGKRLAAHTGFWIIDLWVDGSSVSKLSPTWHPFYA